MWLKENTPKIKNERKPKLNITMNTKIKTMALQKANNNAQSLSLVIERLVAQRYLGITDYR